MAEYKNAIYCCCNSNVWPLVAKELKDNYGIDCKYYVGWPDLDLDLLNTNFPECFTQSIEDAWKGNKFPDYVSSNDFSLDENLIYKFSSEIMMGVQMIDRLDPHKNKFSFTERKYWFITLIEIWSRVINKNGIDIIFSPSIPHRVFDYALYVAAMIFDKKFVMFQQTPFGSRSFIIDDINKLPSNFVFDKGTAIGMDLCLPSEIKDLLDRQIGVYERAIPDYMRRQKFQGSFKGRSKALLAKVKKVDKFYKILSKANTYRIFAANSPSTSTATYLELYYDHFKSLLFKKILQHLYSNQVASTRARYDCLNGKFVLVALHYQPEETSCPSGGAYNEQRQIVKLLLDLLPQDIDIYIKEHKTQFHPTREGECGRSLNFYRSLSKLSNRLVFVDTEENPFMLLDSAIATITINGTIGWESVFRGTPSFVFGRAWYENMPGVFKIKSKSDLSFALKTILSGHYQAPSNDDLLIYHTWLNQKLIVANQYVDHSDLEIDASVENICKSISSFLMIERHKKT